MDFAKKQLEKFGWKEGSGLGKNNQGMLEAIKPSLKVGKEGMGYDFSKELVDTWWTRAYDDSLNRINVERSGDEQTSEIVGVTLKEDEDDDHQNGNERGGLVSSNNVAERPFEKMRKRMMKATFTTFSKGATLSNGEMIVESTKVESNSDDSNDDEAKKKSKAMKALTDEELFQACGGRTAHKAARFGLKLNGKLARIAAQEEAAKTLLSSFKKEKNSIASIVDKTDQQLLSQDPSSSSSQEDFSDKPVKNKKKNKKKSKYEDKEISENPMIEETNAITNTSNSQPLTKQQQLICSENQADHEESETKKKKKKKHKKRKYAELEESQENNLLECSSPDNENLQTEVKENAGNNSSIKTDDSKAHKKSKKSKKRKLSKDNDGDEEARALLSE